MSWFNKDNEYTEESVEITTLADDEPVIKTEKKKSFAFWHVGDETYRLKLTTTNICELESKYKTNLMNVMGSGQNGMPALSVMMDITHAAMKEWQHGIKMKDVQSIFANYVEHGGSQFEFYMSVYMEIFAVSGFFPKALAEEMSTTLKGAMENI